MLDKEVPLSNTNLRNFPRILGICPQGLEIPSMQVKLQSTVIATIQEAAKNFIVGLFKDVNLLAVHAKRVTVMPRYIRLVLRIHGDHY